MRNKKRLTLLICTVVLLVASLTSIFASTLSAAPVASLGASPSISLFDGKLNINASQFYDGTKIYRLPEGVKDTDEISLIVEMQSASLLDRYDALDTDLTFSEYYLTDEAVEVRESYERDAAAYLALLDENSIDYALGDSYSTLFAGFEITVKAGSFLNVCKTLGNDVNVIVGDVYEVSETKLVENDVNAFETGIFDTTGFDYDGTGIVVAVLDTGTDYYHSAFSMENFTASAAEWGLTFEEIEALIGDTVASGFQSGLTAEDVYISGKLPYGFDYADKDSDVFPINSHHGTHVAGIIAGKDDTITGVAPNAQIVTMKIFSDIEQSARTSWILSALEDCVVLGVDVINMSIGTACGFSRETDKEQLSGVYDRVRERGIAMVVAASNSFNSTYASEKNGNLGLTSNPDSATVGSPSTYEGALSVASIEGAKTSYLLFGETVIYFEESSDRVSEEKDFVKDLLGDAYTEREIEYVLIPGSGIEADYSGIDVAGKIALIKRGSSTFEEKANIAQKMGAAGAIIYNNVSGDIKMNVGETTIAVCSISQTDGELLAAQKTGKIKVSYNQKAGPFMSDFSSWGPAPDLSIKPEITAHGGSILSAVPGQDYDRISGTSMATPNVSGVTALLRQFVMANFPESVAKDPVAVTAVVNRLLMSTADIVLAKNGNPYSVRKQGAGLANLVDSAKTGAYILTYDRLDGSVMDKSKIELGDDPEKTGVYTLKFTIDNFGTKAVSYDISAYVMTEGVSDVKTNHGETTVTETSYLLGAGVTVTSVNGVAANGNPRVTVGAGEKCDVVVTVTLTNEDKKYLDESFANGMYVEGFVTLDAADGTEVDLNVPYLAFYGDWTKAPIFDLDYFATNKDELDEGIDLLDKTLPDAYATRPIGGLSDDYVSYLGSFYYQQKPGSNMIAADRKYISLTNQTTGVNKLSYVWAGLLRNASRVEITIVEDATGEVVFETVDNDIRKSYGDGGSIYPANIDIGFSAIDNNLKNNTKYTVTLKSFLDYGDGGENTNLNNTFTFPLTVDFTAPTVTDCEFYTEYDRTAKKNRLYAKIAVYDNHYSMAMLPGHVVYDPTIENDDGTQGGFNLLNFDRYLTQIHSEENSTSYVVYELTNYIDEIKSSFHKNTFTVAVYDYALNYATYEIALPSEYTDLYFEETNVTLSPNQTYDLKPIVYPGTEWGEVIEYTSKKKSVADVVGGKIIAKASGIAAIVCNVTLADGSVKQEVINVTVLKEGDEGYRRFDPPVTDNFKLSGYDVLKAYYFLNSDDRKIGVTGDKMKFVGEYYSLEMYPSESVGISYELDAYFPEKTSVRFESSNSAIVAVTPTGQITAVSEGYATVSVQVLLDGNMTFYSKSISIEVKEPYVTSGPSLAHYYGLGGSVSIPKTLGITDIGQYAFSNFDYVPKGEGDEISDEAPELTKIQYIGDNTIEEVIIPEGVETIGPFAFANLTALRKVKLPSTLKTIDYGAFYGCRILTVVEGIENVKFINRSAFEGCSLNGTLALNSAVAIGDYAFAYNAKISSLRLSVDAQSVGMGAFMDNTGLEEVTIASELIKLGNYVFSGCEKLTTISVNAKVIPTGAFNDCKSLVMVTLGPDVSVIGEYAFRNTAVARFAVKSGNTVFSEVSGSQYLVSADGTKLMLVAPSVTSLNITDSKITAIADGALSGNRNITSFTAPYVTSVGSYAFSECRKLNTVVLGDLDYVGDYAFALTAISALPSIVADEIGDYAFASTNLTFVSVPAGMKVGNGAFQECKLLTAVTVGDGAILGDYAFAYNQQRNDFTDGYYTLSDGTRIYYYIYCSPLDSVTIGNDVNIGKGAFWGASELAALTLGEANIIGDYAFYNAPELVAIVNLDKAVSIGDFAFSGDILYEFSDQDCTQPAIDDDGYYRYRYYAASITTADLSGANSIGKDAFGYCHDLTTVILGDGITELPDGAFRECLALSDINLEKVTSIGAYAFAASALVDIDLSSAKSIGEYAFVESADLTKVILSAIEYIDEGAFGYCEALVTVEGLGGAKHVGDYAFAYTALTSADLTSAEYLGTHAFMKDEANRTAFTLKLGDKLTEIGDNPFVYCDIQPLYVTETESFNGVDYTKEVFTFNLGDSVRIIDGSIYRVVPSGLELIYYCDDARALVEVADGTVRIGAYAFIGTDVQYVTLPYTVESIGHKAFFGCDGLKMVTFTSFYAPILEEEYDVYYFYEESNAPTSPEFSASLGVSGLGIVKYFMWNATLDPTNRYYGANFKNYVGKVSDKIIMVSPSNGVYYDSFIMNQYFDMTFRGASAADDVTLAAFDAISRLPERVSLADKELVLIARELYNKIASNEQKALITNYQTLTNAERRIADLEYLENGPTDKPDTPDDEGTDKPDSGEKEPLPGWLAAIIVFCSAGVLGMIALVAIVIRNKLAPIGKSSSGSSDDGEDDNGSDSED